MTPAELGTLSVKTASPRWIKLLQRGILSPSATQRITSTMPAGSFRTVRNLGQGAYNNADLVAGNVGGQAGLLVRKLPRHQAPQPLTDWYRPVVEESQRVSRVMPGHLAQYLQSTPKGVFQEYATTNILPRPGLWDKLKGWWGGADPAQMATRRFLRDRNQKLIGEGLTDLHPGNISPGGQVIDFLSRRRAEPSVRLSLFGPTNPPIAPQDARQFMSPDAIRRFWAQHGATGAPVS